MFVDFVASIGFFLGGSEGTSMCERARTVHRSRVRCGGYLLYGGSSQASKPEVKAATRLFSSKITKDSPVFMACRTIVSVLSIFSATDIPVAIAKFWPPNMEN